MNWRRVLYIFNFFFIIFTVNESEVLDTLPQACFSKIFQLLSNLFFFRKEAKYIFKVLYNNYSEKWYQDMNCNGGAK